MLRILVGRAIPRFLAIGWISGKDSSQIGRNKARRIVSRAISESFALRALTAITRSRVVQYSKSTPHPLRLEVAA